MASLFAYKLFDNCVKFGSTNCVKLMAQWHLCLPTNCLIIVFEFGASKLKTNWFGVEMPPMASLFACILFDNRVTFGAFNCVKFEASNLKINWN